MDTPVIWKLPLPPASVLPMAASRWELAMGSSNCVAPSAFALLTFAVPLLFRPSAVRKLVVSLDAPSTIGLPLALCSDTLSVFGS